MLGTLGSPFASAVFGASLAADVDGLHVQLSSAPKTPVRDRKTIYTVRLLNAGGDPIVDARVTLTARMMDGMTAAAPLRSVDPPGVYRGELLFTMQGRWDLTVRVARQAERLIEIPVRENVVR